MTLTKTETVAGTLAVIGLVADVLAISAAFGGSLPNSSQPMLLPSFVGFYSWLTITWFLVRRKAIAIRRANGRPDMFFIGYNAMIGVSIVFAPLVGVLSYSLVDKNPQMPTATFMSLSASPPPSPP